MHIRNLILQLFLIQLYINSKLEFLKLKRKYFIYLHQLNQPLMKNMVIVIFI